MVAPKLMGSGAKWGPSDRRNPSIMQPSFYPHVVIFSHGLRIPYLELNVIFGNLGNCTWGFQNLAFCYSKAMIPTTKYIVLVFSSFTGTAH